MGLRTIAIPKPAHSPQEVCEILVKAMTPKTRVLMVSVVQQLHRAEFGTRLRHKRRDP